MWRSLGRRLVNFLPVAQRTNDLTLAVRDGEEGHQVGEKAVGSIGKTGWEGLRKETIYSSTGLYSWVGASRYLTLAELHAGLFSRLASPFEVCVLVAVDERGEDVMSDEICRRCNGKQQRRRGGRRVQLPDWVMNKIKSNMLLLLPGSPK